MFGFTSWSLARPNLGRVLSHALMTARTTALKSTSFVPAIVGWDSRESNGNKIVHAWFCLVFAELIDFRPSGYTRMKRKQKEKVHEAVNATRIGRPRGTDGHR